MQGELPPVKDPYSYNDYLKAFVLQNRRVYKVHLCIIHVLCNEELEDTVFVETKL